MIEILIQKLKTLARTDIIKVFSYTTMSTLVKMLTGFISIKVVAVIIGPAGIALLGQLNNFSNIIMTAASGGINNGITKYVAEYKDSSQKIRLFIGTAFQITILLSIIVSVLLIFFPRYLSKTILLNSSYSYVFIIFGTALILYSLNAYLMSILNGFKQFKKFVKISIITSIIGVFFTIGLVYFWELKGALISAVTYQSVAFFVTLSMITKSPWFTSKNFNFHFSKIVLWKYLSYSLMTIVSAATIPVAQLFIRSYVISHLSVTEAGWWEGMNRISGMYLMVITSSFGVYYLPRLSEINDTRELRKEILTAYKVIIPTLLISFLGIYTFRDLTIRILFSSDFFPMRNLFIWQLIGDLFKVSSWLLAFIMVAKSLTKKYIITEIIFSGLFVGLSVLFLRNGQIVGVTLAYMITYFIYFIAMLLIFNRLRFNK